MQALAHNWQPVLGRFGEAHFDSESVQLAGLGPVVGRWQPLLSSIVEQLKNVWVK